MILQNPTCILCEALVKEIQVRRSQLKCQTKCETNTWTSKSHMLLCKKCASSHFLLIWTQIQVSCWAVNEACTSIDYNAVTSSIDVHSSCSALIRSWCCIGCRHHLACCVRSSCLLTLLPLALFGVKHDLYFQQQLLPFTELVSRSKRGCHNWSVRDTLMAMWMRHWMRNTYQDAHCISIHIQYSNVMIYNKSLMLHALTFATTMLCTFRQLCKQNAYSAVLVNPG